MHEYSISKEGISAIIDYIEKAGVENKTPYTARYAMGRHIIIKTGNISAVQRQLGHRNPAYSMQYSRITKVELDQVISDR